MNTQGLPSFGTKWKNLRAGGQDFFIAHLCPFDLPVELADGPVKIQVAFGHHVFTDDKSTGPAFKYANETRYLSLDRIKRSLELPELLRVKFAEEHSRACRNQHGGKQFFMLQEADWAIFHDLRLRDAASRLFTMRVITAYTLTEASRLSVPGSFNQLYKNQVILSRLLNGEELNHDRRRR